MRRGLTGPLTPRGWAKVLTRSSSSCQRTATSSGGARRCGPAPRGSVPPAGAPRPSAGGRGRRRRRAGRDGARCRGRSARRRRGGRRRRAARTPGRPAGRAGRWRRSPTPDGRGDQAGELERTRRALRRSASRRRVPAPRPRCGPPARPRPALQGGERVGVPRQLARDRARSIDGDRGSTRPPARAERRRRPPAIASRPRSQSAPVTLPRSTAPRVSRSSRRTPPRITGCCRSALVSTRSDTLSSSSSSAG